MVADRPREPSRVAGRWPALLLAIAVHAVFIAVLIFSIRWQNRPAAPVTAELYAPTRRRRSANGQPNRNAKPSRPRYRCRSRSRPPPPPPKAVPQPSPSPNRRTCARPTSPARQSRRRSARSREAIERERLEHEKKEAEKKKQDEQKRLAEARQAREAQDMKAQAEREKAARDAQQQALAAEATARSRAEADYIRRIQAKVRGNVTLPPDLVGNPEAIFEVVQLPTGEIIDATLKKSSGVRAYDEAVQRAIQKSSPLPRPDRPELFQRALTLKFRPQD